MPARDNPSVPDQGLSAERISAVRCHLERVLASKAFAGSKRSQDFLRLIVEHALAGRLDNLRERMIGAEMFGRPVDYDTANDAVVRVKAIEVRRRLAQYYAQEGTERDAVWMDLPTGTYVPEFHWEPIPQPAAPDSSNDAGVLPIETTQKPRLVSRRRVWIGTSVAAGAALTAVAIYVAVHSSTTATSAPSFLNGSLTRLTFDPGYTTDGTISPDGRLIAYASDRGGGNNLNIYVQQSNGGNSARFTDDPADDYEPAFSPDGAQIAFRSERNGGGIYEVSSMRGPAHLIVPGGRRPRFSPDGRYLLYSQAAGGFDSKWGDWGASLFTVEVAGGSPVLISRPCTFVNNGAVWSPDSKRILFAGICQGRPGIWLASPDGKVLESSAVYTFWKQQKLESVDPSTAPVFDDWLKSPSRLLAPLAAGEDVSYEASLSIAGGGSKSTGTIQPLVFGPSRITGAAASESGEVILSAEDRSSSIWMLKIDPSGHATGNPVPVKTGSSVNYQPAISKDGRNVVFVARESGAWEAQVINLATGALTHLAVRLPYLWRPVFNATGDKISYAGQLPGTERRSDYELSIGSGVPSTILETSLGGIWDTSPAGPWLLTHDVLKASGSFAAALGSSFDDNRPARDSISVFDRNTSAVIPFLSDPNSNIYQAHFSHDGRWVAFNSARNQHSRIYVAPFSEHLVPIANWIPITDGTTWDDKPGFSFDDKLIFFTSDRDGFRCIWAQRVSPDMRPSGAPFAVCHFHSRIRSIANVPIGLMELAVGPQVLIFNQGEYTGNLWLYERK